MMQSMVDYVLERGNADYGQFADKQKANTSSALFNHRKLLLHLFNAEEHQTLMEQNDYKHISDMKIEEIAGQLNYFSQKVHAQLSKKNYNMDNDLYKLQNQWMKKKIPDFYCYYFLKFAYANSYSRMEELFLSELQNMNRQRDTYHVVKKSIEAREICINSLRKELSVLTDIEIQESIQGMLGEERQKKKKKLQNQNRGYTSKKGIQNEDQQVGKSWKDKIQLVCQSISHLRKMSCYVIELIKNWKNSIYGMSEDPRRYRQRVIYYHNDANYLLKMLFDNAFLKTTVLAKYLQISSHYDPFLLRPVMVLENKNNISEEQEILRKLIKPAELQMNKIVKGLVILAEEDYDQTQQSKFIHEKKQHGELEHRKNLIQRKKGDLNKHNTVSVPKINNKQASGSEFIQDKKSINSKLQLESINKEKQISVKTKIQTSLNRVKKIRSIDLKKVSPYLNRNQRIQKAQKVVELEHKFRIAQDDYLDTIKNTKKNKQESPQLKQIRQQAHNAEKQIANSRIFNKYIEQNLRRIDEANKKAYMYKNEVKPTVRSKVTSLVNFNKMKYQDRKETEYEQNLQTYYPHTKREKNNRTHGTKAVIEISNKGVRNTRQVMQYELSGRKGKNIGGILADRQKQQEQQMVKSKLGSKANINRKNETKEEGNLFETEKHPQIIIMRQEPEKIEEIKQYLYVKIKEELMQEMKKDVQQKEDDLNQMVEQEKQKKLNQIIQQRQREEEERKQDAQRNRLARIEMQRKKMDLDVRVQPIQYAEQNVQGMFQKVFAINPHIYESIFTHEKLDNKKEELKNQLHYILFRCTFEHNEIGYCLMHLNCTVEGVRIFIIDYLVTVEPQYYISTIYQISEFCWKNDPMQQICLTMLKNDENTEGVRIIEDVEQFIEDNGQIFQKRLYSNILEKKFVMSRPNFYHNSQFQHQNYSYSQKLNFRAELLSANLSLYERQQPNIDMNLQVFTNYIFLLEELFRSYLTPEEVVELRQNSNNVRRLKDIFRIILQFQTTNPIVDQLKIVQGLNLTDLYDKLKTKVNAPYDRYYWSNFYDKTTQNRLLLSILEINLKIQFPINSCQLDSRRYLRINPRKKVLTLRSSIYSTQNIYILGTDNPKIRIFFMEGEPYKLMRMQLFIFLNLVFNNIVTDTEKYVNSFWIPQFVVASENGKKVNRITDFSISMRKSFFLAEEIYFCNNSYIKNAVSFLPKQSDVIYRNSLIIGMLHTVVEQASTGIPLYAKLIDKNIMF